MMQLHVGTSGYSYKEWKGHFYPEDMSDKEFLKYYGTQLTAVEINNTFYRMPKESVVQGWADQVPKGFCFSIKASQKITHFKRLKDAGEEVEYLMRTVRTIGDKLGVVLFQLPPNLKKDVERLGEFLKLLPGDIPASFEFRHATWFADDVYELLRSYKCALCCADVDEDLEFPFVGTANWGYLRLRREAYSTADLKSWLKKIEDQKWKKAFVFFKHEDEGTGPKLAKKFIELIG